MTARRVVVGAVALAAALVAGHGAAFAASAEPPSVLMAIVLRGEKYSKIASASNRCPGPQPHRAPFHGPPRTV